MKISYSDAKKIKRLSQKELTFYLESIYKSGYDDGYTDCQMQRGNEIDFELLKIAIKATEGIGDILYNRLCETIDKLCFQNNDEGSE